MTAAFEKLARPVQKWIRAQGWSELRPIQAQAVHAITEHDTDLIVAATTAGGKTEAAFLPLISQLLQEPTGSPGFELLYIGPLKALITDQANRLSEMCQEAEIQVTPWHGDISASVKSRAVKAPKGILLITPESLEALFIRRGLEIPRLFGATRAIVIDELHSVLDSARGIQMRSLLTRMELAVKRRIRRIGLSATLGDMSLARAYLRPDNPGAVHLLEAKGGDSELLLQLRGYVTGDKDESAPSAERQIARHLFKNLRGSNNLVFAGSRQSVEIYSDHLRSLCEDERLPQEFYPHHASLSRDHREFVETRLKDAAKPTTAICTSTLELGIDIGDVVCVAQVGAPYSVASLRQRLGRSGRRAGQPAVLRQYAVEARLTPESDYIDRLRLGLVRSIAMIDLLLEGWCEPPRAQALQLSTLVHQILSVVAEKGGASARLLFRTLCQDGPFKGVDAATMTQVLRALGRPEVALLEQGGDGLLLLGQKGEKLVEHYSFYAVFQTPEEYRLVSRGKELGTLPLVNVMAPGMMIIFSGRRWIIEEIDDTDKVILVVPAKGGTPPSFGGDPGDIHDRIVQRMFEIFEGEAVPSYLDAVARDLLAEGRRNFEKLGFGGATLAAFSEKRWAVATRVGTVKTNTLALALRSSGFTVETFDGFLTATREDHGPHIEEALHRLATGEPTILFGENTNLLFDKFHPYLTRPLLEMDALSSRVDARSLPEVCSNILSGL